MSKISRNDPCPCGSGKKHKKCCMDKILQFPQKLGFDDGKRENADQFLEMVKREFEQGAYNSLDDANERLSTLSWNYNETPASSFLGLSPAQMQVVLNSPCSLKNFLFTINYPGELEIEKVPLIKQGWFFLSKLNEVGEFRATQKGNLPKAFVIELYYEFFSNHRYARLPNGEDDLLAVARLKSLLNIAGFIKKRKGKFTLTKKGEDVLEKNELSVFFNELFLAYINKWNWAYGDRYSELPLIQRSAVFNFHLVNKKCQAWILDDELGQYYLDAFPDLANEVHGYSGPEKEVINCFVTRFIERVCIPLGLIETREEGSSWSDRKTFYRITTLFKKCFESHID